MERYPYTSTSRHPLHLGPLERVIWSLAIFLAGFLTADTAAAASWSDAQWQLHDIIQQHAKVYRVSPATMIRVATCESQMGLFRLGDHGRSHGPFQLNDRPTGLLHHFYEMGYDNPYSYNQSADYYARVLSGEWAYLGITAKRWSCR